MVGFLKHLWRHVRGKLVVIWDRVRIHRSQALKSFLSQGGAERLHIEPLPSYAKEMNADEGIWQHLKGVELKNVWGEELSVLLH